ncbi:MAG: Asp-tRNA(Asn)/Glu-tRNA(Gln) amidotransferase subunit GatC [Candidatus Dormibacteria bacterium]
MSLSADDVRHVATLARLGLDDAEREQLAAQLDAILHHISRLNAIDTGAVAETAQVSGLVNVWREDERADSLPVEAALANAPVRQGNHFQVGAIQE